LSGALLVGNFGDGRIHAYDASSGKFLATLTDPDGEPIVIDGLWALKVGNGTANGGDKDKVYFTAGLAGERHGLFGSLAPVAEDTREGPDEAEGDTAAQEVRQIDLNPLLADLESGAPMDTLKQVLKALRADFPALVRAEGRFAIDARADLGGGGGKGHHD